MRRRIPHPKAQRHPIQKGHRRPVAVLRRIIATNLEIQFIGRDGQGRAFKQGRITATILVGVGCRHRLALPRLIQAIERNRNSPPWQPTAGVQNMRRYFAQFFTPRFFGRTTNPSFRQ